MKFSLSLVLLTSLGWHSLIQAQETKGHLGVGAYASGVMMILGDVDHSTIDQWGGISISYGISEKFNLKFNGAYGWVYPRDPNGSQFQPTGNFKTLLYPVTLSLDWLPDPNKSFRPFLTFGGGILNWDVRDMRGTESVWDQGESINGRTTNVSVLVGVGVEKFLSAGISTSLFARIHYLLKGNEDTIGTGDDNRAVAEVGIGLTFFNNPNKDTDGDGIFDRWDLCVDAAEDYDNYKDLDGCPDLDNDEDGILDKLDSCPDLPEDLDGFQDEDGCPDIDNDGDGIPDLRDKCPNIAEDIDNFQDDDGCPDPDNDGDGIEDDKDKCPNEAENMNGFEDGDGCPDEKPEILTKETPIILKGINFESGSSRLTFASFIVLDTVFQTLTDHQEIEIEIRGYTDSSGDWTANLKLSQQRADVIKLYIIKKGIAAERMRAVGYGESNPIASNASPEGRAANRRIEFARTK